MANLDVNSAVPLYRQLVEKIKVDHVYNNSNIDMDGPIPSEKELIQQYNVSRITVRNAVNELVKEGVLQKTQGKGTFVVERKNYPMGHGGGFSQSCAMMKVEPSTKLISIEKMLPAAEEQEFFNMKKGEKLLRIKRLRLGDGRPMILERLYLPMSYENLTHENLEGSFYALLQNECGIIINTGSRWIEIYRASQDDADLLGLAKGDPVILTRECAYDQNKNPLHSTKLLIRPEFRFYFR